MNQNFFNENIQDNKELKSNNNLIIGNRIPKDYFITSGTGESDITIHAGSYHLALKNAGIHMCNIMTYSSILPKCSMEVKKKKDLIHGSVMETIMAVSDVEKGERATAGIIYGILREKKSNQKFGGLVCEYNGQLSKKDSEKQLNDSLLELYMNGYAENFNLTKIRLISKSFIPKKKFGTALVALCFINYLYPVYGEYEV
jgi:arginine decarboxylase